MKLTTKTRYGIKAMYYLAQCDSPGPLSLNNIAENIQVTKPYLEKILSILKKGNLVKTSQGVKGGYSLAHEPSKTNLSKIIDVLEGQVLNVKCVKDCNNDCPNRSVFSFIYNKIDFALKDITLEDIANTASNGVDL